MAGKRSTNRSIRDVALWMLANAVVLALPLGLRADPAVPPPAAAPSLTVTRPEMADAASRREAARAAILDARLAELHAGLKLTAAQDALWPPVADAIRGLDKARGRRFRLKLESADNSIDGLKMQGDHMVKVGAAMGKLADATQPLVASLTPDQKSRLPALLQRVRPRKVIARAFELPADTQSNDFAPRPTAAPSGTSSGAVGRSAVQTGAGAEAMPGNKATGSSQADDDDD